MARVYPDREHREEIYDDIDQSGESAERTICDWIEKSIKDEDCIARLHPQITTRNPDLLVLVPNRGLLVIEVKQYSMDFLECYDDNSLLQVKKEFRKGEYENGVKHPYKQATEYVLTISNDFPKFLKQNGFNLPVCKIGCMIAMPNLSDDEYRELLLMYGLETELAITKDWLTSEEVFYQRFTNAVNIIFRNMNSDAEFNDNYYKIARTYLLPSEMARLKQNIVPKNEKNYSESSKENAKDIDTSNELANIEQILYGDCGQVAIEEKFNYSLTRILFNTCDMEVVIDECMQLRKRGTKIYLLCIDFDDQCKQRMIDQYSIITKKDVKDYKNNSYTDFLFYMYFVLLDQNEFDRDILQKLADQDEYVNIIDGELIERIYSKKSKDQIVNEYVPTPNNGIDAHLWKLLIKADNKTLFNFDQYIVEHFPIKLDMCVTASAGTGKTYTMVDRIAFLVHKEIIEGDINRSIDNLIAMMTFTNNSTDEMKERLRNHYANYFAMTKKNIYMNIVEQIGEMKIKTIDAMSRFVITKFAHFIGLSCNFTVKSGKYDVGNILRKNLDYYINQGILEYFGDKKIYQVQEYITECMDFILNRKIRFDNKDCKNVLANNIVNDNDVKNFIENVIKETNGEYFNYNRENDYLAMNEIGVQVDRVRKQLGELTYEKSEYEKYLFVDEFQDTDNKQIELLHFFATYWNMALFIVGDVKQCIYGFRGANDTAFETIEKITDYKKRTWNVLHLRKNYRTDEALVNKMNTTFSKMPAVLFSYSSNDILIPQKGLDKPDSNCFSKDLYSDETLINILRKRKIELQGIGGDIAILVRKNSEINKIRRINELVDDLKIEFDNGGNFFKTDAIIDFYQLVDFLSEIFDIKRMYNISISPYCRNQLARYELFNKSNSITIEEFDKLAGFDDKNGFAYYHGIITDDHEEQPCLKNSPTLKILRMLINEIKPWERYIPEVLINVDFAIKENMDLLSDARNEYKKHLFQMFQILIENNKSDYVTLNKIKRYLNINIQTKQKHDILTENIILNKKQVKIICTTVHKSKGLQYDTVILPYTTTDITGDNGISSFIEHKDISGNSIIEYNLRESRFKEKSLYKSALYDKLYGDSNKNQQAEELRILYVALTRAKKKFVYLYDKEKVDKNVGKTKKYWSEYLK